MLIVLFFVDILTLFGCTWVLFRNGRLSYTHPGTVYLIFHVITFTSRILELVGGAPTLFSDQVSWTLGWHAVGQDEIIRAVLVGDVALVAMTIAWLKAAEDDHRNNSDHPAQKAKRHPLTLDERRLLPVAVGAIIVGTVGMLSVSALPGRTSSGVDFGMWGNSSWVTNTQMWLGIAVLALIYWYGFRRSLLLIISVYLFVMAYQGFNRFRVIIPALLLSQVYLDRKNLRWPTRWMVVAILLLALVFIPLKSIGQMAQQGKSLSEIIESSINSLTSTTNGGFSELGFLDQFASALTLSDEAGHFYYGTTYLSILTLPIPRPLWPDKPALNFYLPEISTPARPMAQLGMIVTLVGESYINFGYLGVIVVPFLLAYWLARFYFYAYRQGYFSVTHFLYLLTASSLIQVYRDGLTSLVLFTLVQYMPLMLIVGLHVFFPPRRLQPVRQQLG